MKKFFVIILLIVTSVIQAGGGSVYTRFGLGDLHHSYLAPRFGMGGGGVSLSESNYLSAINPASWYRLNMTRFETGVGFSLTGAADNSNTSDYSQSLFSGFLFGFPIQKDLGISFVCGIVPFSDVKYEVFDNSFNAALGEDIKTTFGGSGSLSKVFFGTSSKLPLDFVIGASFEYYTGKIEYSTSVEFGDDSKYRDLTFSKSKNYGGMGGTFGLISSDLSTLFGWDKLTDFRIGSSLSFTGKFDTDTSEVSETVLGSSTFSSGVAQTEIPYKLSLGTSFFFDKDFLVTIDYTMQPWSEFKYQNVSSNQLRDFTRVSAGVEYKNKNERLNTFWEQVALRGGFSYEQTQYLINGKGIDQMALHLGCSLPMSQTSTIDIGFMAGIRGTKENDLLKETFIKTMVSINFGDLWFVRPDR
ncbi:MAG: hypothetical protein V1720_16705 [bacterium]